MKYFIENKHWPINKDYNIDKMLYLLIDRPNEIDDFNNLVWGNKKGLHRDYNLPAYIGSYSNTFWYKNGMFHRNNNKPAYISNNGCKQYWINDNFIKEEK